MKRTVVVINGEKSWHGYLPESEYEVAYRRLQDCSWVLRDGVLWCVDREAALRVEGVLWRVGAIRPQAHYRTALELIRLSGVPCAGFPEQVRHALVDPLREKLGALREPGPRKPDIRLSRTGPIPSSVPTTHSGEPVMSETAKTLSNVKKYTGGCLCGAVRFEVELDLSEPVSRCNCTICTKLGGSTTSVKPSAFRLLSGKESLGEYRRNGSPNYRNFCKHCGVHCFGAGDVPELGGAFAGVSVNCLDGVDVAKLTHHYWDGRNDNWQAGPRNEPWPLRA